MFPFLAEACKLPGHSPWSKWVENAQYFGSHSYQEKGRQAKSSPLDPELPWRSDVEAWNKADWDVITSSIAGDREFALRTLFTSAQSKDFLYEFKFTGEIPLIDNLRPDAVMILKGHSIKDLRSIGALINLDSTTEGCYDSDEKVGKVITYGQVFLKLAGTQRRSVVVGVMNLNKVRFFKVARVEGTNYPSDAKDVSGFVITRSQEDSDVRRAFSAYLQSKLCILNLEISGRGFPLPLGWKEDRILGRGRTSFVHLVISPASDDSQKEYAAKVAREGFKLDEDFQYLNALVGIDGIPRVKHYIAGCVLVMEPVGIPFTFDSFYTYRNEPMVGGLVDVLEAAHSRKIVHRDIRPDNAMIANSFDTGEKRLFLLDWGFATKVDVVGCFSGSLITASDRVLVQHMEGKEDRLIYHCSDDLVSLVRCLFLFSIKGRVSIFDHCDSPSAILKFWQSSMNGKSLWETAQSCALKVDYAALKEALQSIQLNCVL